MKTRLNMKAKHIKAVVSGACMVLASNWVLGASPAGGQVSLGEDFLREMKILMYILAFIALLIVYIAIVLSVKDAKQLSLRHIWDGIVGRNSPDPETDHDYDGIKELDNPMPAWLRLVFYGSIGFAFAYMLHYHVLGTGPSSKEEYEAEVAWAEETFKSVELPEDQIILVTDAGRLQKAEALFVENCATCHRKDFGGESGPNLTDAYWLHGGSVKAIYSTITNGVPGKSMISWKDRITSSERLALASLILSKAGSNPQNPRAPEGTLAGEQPAADSAPAAQDSAGNDTVVTH